MNDETGRITSIVRSLSKRSNRRLEFLVELLSLPCRHRLSFERFFMRHSFLRLTTGAGSRFLRFNRRRRPDVMKLTIFS